MVFMLSLSKSKFIPCMLAAIFAACVSLSTLADELQIKSDYPERYVVVKGDTLWDISERFLKDPWRWPEIWAGNDQIANPHLIYPGDIIRLIFIDGKPRLVINDNVPTRTSKEAAKTIKLSPKIREIPIKKAVSTIPLTEINAFLSRTRIVAPDELEKAPHILAGKDGRIILSPGLNAYARGDFSNGSETYNIYRNGHEYIDPETGTLLGIQAIDVGSANISALEDDIATFNIVRSTTEVRVGDRLLPRGAENIATQFQPTPISNDATGQIMTVERGVSQAGRLDIITLNLGEENGLSQGDLLGIFKKGWSVRDRNAQPKTSKNVTLPDERAGLVMVFQTFPNMSLGIILEAESGIKIGDIVTAP
jgi:hypothetical protein